MVSSSSSSTSPSASSASDSSPASSPDLASGESTSSTSSNSSRLDEFVDSVETLDRCRVVVRPGPSSGCGGGSGTRVKMRNKSIINDTDTVATLSPVQDFEESRYASLSALSPTISDSDSSVSLSKFSKRGRFVDNNSSAEDNHEMEREDIEDSYFDEVDSVEEEGNVCVEAMPQEETIDEIVYDVPDEYSDVVELTFDTDANNENNADSAQDQLSTVSNRVSNSNNTPVNRDDSDTRLSLNNYGLSSNDGVVVGVSEVIVSHRNRGTGPTLRQHSQQATGTTGNYSTAPEGGVVAASSSSSTATAPNNPVNSNGERERSHATDDRFTSMTSIGFSSSNDCASWDWLNHDDDLSSESDLHFVAEQMPVNDVTDGEASDGGDGGEGEASDGGDGGEGEVSDGGDGGEGEVSDDEGELNYDEDVVSDGGEDIEVSDEGELNYDEDVVSDDEGEGSDGGEGDASDGEGHVSDDEDDVIGLDISDFDDGEGNISDEGEGDEDFSS